MKSFKEEVNRYFGPFLNKQEFYLEENTSESIAYYYRHKKGVYQCIRIENYGNWRIELDVYLNKQEENEYDHRKTYYCYNKTTVLGEIKEGWFFYPKVKKYEKLFSIIHKQLIDVEMDLLERRLDDFIIRYGWNTEVYKNLNDLVMEYRKKREFPNSIREMSKQFQEIFLELEGKSWEEIKKHLIQLTAVYVEYYKRVYTNSIKITYAKRKYSDLFMIKLMVQGEEIIVFHPLLIMYRTWVTRDMENLTYINLYQFNKDKQYRKVMEPEYMKNSIIMNKVQ